MRTVTIAYFLAHADCEYRDLPDAFHYLNIMMKELREGDSMDWRILEGGHYHVADGEGEPVVVIPTPG